MADQDRALWDRTLMQKGFFYLEKSTAQRNLSIYHMLAAISAYHCSAPDFASTDWKSILSLYDKLIQTEDSPVILLNRAIVVSKVEGALQGLNELDKIRDSPALKSYHLYYSAKAEFYIELGKLPQACQCLKKAIELAPLQAEKDLLKRKLDLCTEK
jgi:RNA polymerase sigma-70 factor (ECF subfamily)